MDDALPSSAGEGRAGIPPRTRDRPASGTTLVRPSPDPTPGNPRLPCGSAHLPAGPAAGSKSARRPCRASPSTRAPACGNEPTGTRAGTVWGLFRLRHPARRPTVPGVPDELGRMTDKRFRSCMSF